MTATKKLYYLGLESYSSRYTYQLTDWNAAAFERLGINYSIIRGQTLYNDNTINTGQVLDAHGRPYFAMSQMQSLIKKLSEGEITSNDVIYFEDMFHPGIESLPYIFAQTPKEQRPKVYVRCLAQTIDPDDFVNKTGMTAWMKKYEEMVTEFVDGVLASSEEMVAHIKIAGWKCPIYNISGLAFGKAEVRSRVSELKPWSSRKRRVVFSSRWDTEKQPKFYMELARQVYHIDESIEFCVVTGNKELKSDDPELVNLAYKMQNESKINFKVITGLSKNQYYDILNDSQLVFNCALQDWISNTVSEADALGCNVLFPAYRSFPEVFANDDTRMYTPWSINSAMDKLFLLTDNPSNSIGKISDWTDKTIDRIIDIVMNNNQEWLRSDDYRSKVAESKYD